MGFLFQHAALYDSLTVEQNVMFPLQHHRKYDVEVRAGRPGKATAGRGGDGRPSGQDAFGYFRRHAETSRACARIGFGAGHSAARRAHRRSRPDQFRGD